jgi:SARP family transcriptional regulator, regulator of embCAB operon
MDLRLLGPFEARVDGRPVALGGRRQERCLLGLLLLAAGRAVSTPRLIELLWDEQRPESARGTVHTYVGRLRPALARYGLRIDTRQGGYAIEAGGHRLDVNDFVDLVRRAGAAAGPVEQVRLYDRALGLWRGPLLADVADESLRARLDPELAELRLSSLHRRAEVQLDMGQQDRVVTDLMPLADLYATREGLVALVMTALYRSSRQAEALRLYEGTAAALGRDLGVAPGPELRGLRERIRRDDPRLRRPVGPTYAVRVRSRWLPWSVGGHPALEFCNTYAGWGAPRLARGEWLRDYTTLATWAGHVGLADPPTVTGLLRLARRLPREAVVALNQARALRTSLYRCLTDADDRDAFAAVARFAEAAAKAAVFERDDCGLGRWGLPLSTGLRLPVHAAAHSAADLLGDPRRHTVCACPGDHCGWLFLNPTGRRVFCSITTCARRGPAPRRRPGPGEGGLPASGGVSSRATRK